MSVPKLTQEEIDGINADVKSRMAALARDWEKSQHTDIHALLGGLVFCQARLPPWVFTGLFRFLSSQMTQEPGLHWVRWLVVSEAHLEGLSWKEAYKIAHQRLAGTPYAGSAWTMKASYILCKKSCEKSRRG